MVKKEEKVKTLRETIQMGFNLEEGPCIKGIESCLTSFGVCRQRYYGGIFVGNHVHKIYACAMLCGHDMQLYTL